MPYGGERALNDYTFEAYTAGAVAMSAALYSSQGHLVASASQAGNTVTISAAGKLLYVGKAKVLKNRVKSYFSFTPTLAPSPRLAPRIAKMIAEAVHIEWIETSSESDALILENSFIKQLRPKYNILLRDDKTYPYIYVDFSEPYPRPVITRKLIKGTKIRYLCAKLRQKVIKTIILYSFLPRVRD